MIERRSFLKLLGFGGAAVLAAPAIVRATSLMPISVEKPLRFFEINAHDGVWWDAGYEQWKADPTAQQWLKSIRDVTPEEFAKKRLETPASNWTMARERMAEADAKLDDIIAKALAA
jgi:hypothetical protein